MHSYCFANVFFFNSPSYFTYILILKKKVQCSNTFAFLDLFFVFAVLARSDPHLKTC